jgi:anti-sigma regulatory factor (Ser/Thr protein kinase)
MARRRLTIDLPRAPTAPRQARLTLADVDHGLTPRRLEDAELMVSELVCNAVKYGEGDEVQVEFERHDGRFRTEVVDQGHGYLPASRHSADPRTPGGWGLPLVEALADRWGAHNGSTHVWFELSL